MQAGAGRPSAGPREPQRQLVRWMEVEGSAHRPSLDQRSSLPQRRADVGLHDVDAGGELQLGRHLHLRVHAAHGPDDLHEAVACRALVQR